jgi:MiaB-like tRNA modifying enzyme
MENIDSLKLRSLKPKLIENITLLNKNNKYDTNDTNNRAIAQKLSTFNEYTDQRKIKPSFWIEGYGCSASFSDMEMIAGQLKNNGFDIANNPSESSINLIVTCSVKDATEHRMIHRIKKLSQDNKPLVIAGCLPAADKKLVEKLNLRASLMGPNSISNTIEIVNSALLGNKSISLSNLDIEKISYPKLRINPMISIIEISTGCLSECSFCQTKLAKGNLRSYRIGNIINQIKHDLSEGIKEIWLTSTDNGCYGRDIGTNLVGLIRKCIEIENNDFMIRVGMMNPMYMKDMIYDLVDIYSKSNKIFKFIHIPVQSGSERILRKMKRGHTAKTFKQIITHFRTNIPDITIATDIITGFPGETEEDFELTLNMISELEPDIINSSKYSARPGTVASKLARIDPQTMINRSERLHTIIKRITKKRNERWLNWEGDILIDEIDKGQIKGRNQYYKSIILKYRENAIMNINDGEKYSKNNNNSNRFLNIKDINSIETANDYNSYLGKTLRVKVIGCSEHTLESIQIS